MNILFAIYGDCVAVVYLTIVVNKYATIVLHRFDISEPWLLAGQTTVQIPVLLFARLSFWRTKHFDHHQDHYEMTRTSNTISSL